MTAETFSGFTCPDCNGHQFHVHALEKPEQRVLCVKCGMRWRLWMGDEGHVVDWEKIEA
jgi:transcription elongation factor Elf1